jgi:DNA-binding PadR family transcriptional regulator
MVDIDRSGDRSSFGQTYRLSRTAVQLRSFTAYELTDLTGIVEDTVYGFLARMLKSPQGYLEWEELPRSTRGRPVKRYRLTEAGVDHLLRKNAQIAALLQEDVPARRPAVAAQSAPVAAEAAPQAFAALYEPRRAAHKVKRTKHAAGGQEYEAMS